MRVEATEKAERAVERMKQHRTGSLTITIGTGCCESTAPFLYEDFWPGPDQAQIGEVVGVPVFAPAYLRSSYGSDEGVVIDLIDAQKKQLVWRGKAVGIVGDYADSENRINEAVKKLFQHYPPPK